MNVYQTIISSRNVSVGTMSLLNDIVDQFLHHLNSVACVRGFPMVPLVINICTICTNLITNGTIGREIGANGTNGKTIGTNGTNVTNQWYHCENHEHTQCLYWYILYLKGDQRRSLSERMLASFLSAMVALFD